MARTAVIVLQGVGNQRLGEAAENVALGIAAQTGVTPTGWTEAYLDPVLPEKHGREKWNARIPERRPRRQVPRWEIPGGRDGPPIDVVEFGWADLSSFPVRARSFVAALVHLLLEIGYLGERALKGTAPITPTDVPPLKVRREGTPVEDIIAGESRMRLAPDGSTHALPGQARLARAIAQALALVLVPVLWAQAWLALALTVALIFPGGHPILLTLALGGLLAVAGAVSWLVFAKYPYGIRLAVQAKPTSRRDIAVKWFFERQMRIFSLLALLAVMVIAIIAVARPSPGDAADELAEAVLWMSAFVLRPIWIAIAVMVLALAVALLGALRLSRRGDARGEAPPERRRAVTALLTGLAGPTTVAFLAVALISLVGFIADKAIPTENGGANGIVTCAQVRACVSDDGASPPPAPTDGAWSGTDVPCLSEPTDWTTQPCDQLIGDPFPALVSDDHPADNPEAWGAYGLGLAVAPVIVTVTWLLLALVATVAWMLASGGVARLWRRIRHVDVSDADRQGRWLSRWVNGPDTRAGSAWILAIVAVATLCVLFSSLPLGTESLWESDQLSWIYAGEGTTAAAATGAGLTGARLVLLLGSAIGVSALLRNSAWFRGIADVLDRVRDVAVYLREPEIDGARGRDEIQVRFRALVRHVLRRPRKDRYDRLVVVAHSQGSVLATRLLALLPRDLIARPFAYDAEPPGPPWLPPRISLITFGSPLRQLYNRRLPGQFAWLDGGIAQARRDYVTRISGTWLNFVTAGDYIGRRLGQPVARASWDAETAPFDWTKDRDVLLGQGSHGDYWRDARFLEAIWALSGRTSRFPMPKR